MKRVILNLVREIDEIVIKEGEFMKDLTERGFFEHKTNIILGINLEDNYFKYIKNIESVREILKRI